MSIYSPKVSADYGVLLDIPGSRGRDYFNTTFSGRSMASSWEGLTLYPTIDPKRKEQDFLTCLSSSAYVISARAADVIARLPEKGFELLEVNIYGLKEPYYIINVTAIVDCLDRAASKLLYAPDDPEKILTVRNIRFKDTNGINVAAFRIPELQGRFFVRKCFVDAVVGSKLTGVYFEDPAHEAFGSSRPLWGTPFLTPS